MEGIEACKVVRNEHIAELRRIASELEKLRKDIGLQARDPLLVQSLKELATKVRQGQMKQQPPKIELL